MRNQKTMRAGKSIPIHRRENAARIRSHEVHQQISEGGGEDMELIIQALTLGFWFLCAKEAQVMDLYPLAFG